MDVKRICEASHGSGAGLLCTCVVFPFSLAVSFLEVEKGTHTDTVDICRPLIRPNRFPKPVTTLGDGIEGILSLPYRYTDTVIASLLHTLLGFDLAHGMSDVVLRNM